MRLIARTQAPEERQLVEQFSRTRSEPAFRRLYRAHTPRMLRLAQRLTRGSAAGPEDVVQEAWVRAVRALGAFEWRSSLAAWLGGFVVNVAREQRRSMGPSESNTADDEVDWADPLVRIAVLEALDQLPPGFRSVLTLHDVAGFTHQEIATILNVEPGTSKSQLARARERIRALLTSKQKDTMP